MKLLEFYQSVLEAVGFTVNSEGFVSIDTSLFSPDNPTQPAMVGGKRLVLPTYEQLSSPSTSETIRFHPLRENLMRGESEVSIALRKAVTTRLSYSIVSVMQGLLLLGASPALHAKLTPEQTEFLSIIPDVDTKSVTTFSELFVKTVAPGSTTPIITVYLKDGGEVKGSRFSKAAIVRFPLYDELKEDKKDCMGIDLRKKDKLAFIKLFEYILIGIDQPGSFSRGSNSDQAPYFEALMNAFVAVSSKIDITLRDFGDHIEGSDFLRIDPEWVETLNELGTLSLEIQKIPMQSGNEGASKLKDVKMAAGAQQPLVTNIQAPAPQPAPISGVFNQPPPQYQNQNQPPPVINRTGRGLDFNSLKQAGLVKSGGSFGHNVSNNNGWGNNNQQRQPQPGQPRSNWNGGGGYGGGGGWGNNGNNGGFGGSRI